MSEQKVHIPRHTDDVLLTQTDTRTHIHKATATDYISNAILQYLIK